MEECQFGSIKVLVESESEEHLYTCRKIRLANTKVVSLIGGGTLSTIVILGTIVLCHVFSGFKIEQQVWFRVLCVFPLNRIAEVSK